MYSGVPGIPIHAGRRPPPPATGRALPQLLPLRRPMNAVTARQPSGLKTLPAHGRIGLLVRGEAFRCMHVKGAGCNKDFMSVQLNATLSLVQHVIAPLEARHLPVDIVLSSCGRQAAAHNPAVAHLHHVVELLGRHRLLASSAPSCHNFNQGESVRRTIDLFVEHAMMPKGLPKSIGRAERLLHIPELYSLIMITRIDLVFKLSIVHWQHVNFARFLFYAGCARAPFARGVHGGSGPQECVEDQVHIMTGHHFRRWEPIVGPGAPLYGCFFGFGPNLWPTYSGHPCYNATARAIGELPGFILTDPKKWPGVENLKTPKRPIMHLAACCRHSHHLQSPPDECGKEKTRPWRGCPVPQYDLDDTSLLSGLVLHSTHSNASQWNSYLRALPQDSLSREVVSRYEKHGARVQQLQLPMGTTLGKA